MLDLADPRICVVCRLVALGASPRNLHRAILRHEQCLCQVLTEVPIRVAWPACDHLVDQLFILEGDSQIKVYNGNYTDYRIEKEEAEQALEHDDHHGQANDQRD